jgi:hypothetical protein
VSILFTAAPHILALIGSGTLIAFATFMLVGLAVGHWLGGPEAEDRTALAYSSASRHPGIARNGSGASVPAHQHSSFVAVSCLDQALPRGRRECGSTFDQDCCHAR